jgi:hypothetical protein
VLYFSSPNSINVRTTINIKIEIIVPSIAPSHVLLGEIFGDILCFPNRVPQKNAIESFNEASATKIINVVKKYIVDTYITINVKELVIKIAKKKVAKNFIFFSFIFFKKNIDKNEINIEHKKYVNKKI